jgi:hypothetical protein
LARSEPLVARLKTDNGLAIGLVKGPAFYDVKNTETGEYLQKKEPFTLVYVPGIGDAMAWPRNIVTVDPPCSECNGTTWHWRGEDPLFPDEILCASCSPPLLTKQEIRRAGEEIIELLVNKDSRFTSFKDVFDEWCEHEWPWIQKRLLSLWLLLLSDTGDYEDILFSPADQT